MSPKTCSALMLAALYTSTTVATAAETSVCFLAEGRLHMVQREVSGQTASLETALAALMAGPTEEEKAAGISSAIAPGVTVKSVKVDGRGVTIDFSADVLKAAVSDTWLEAVYQQVRWTLGSLNMAQDIRLTVAGTDLSDYLPATPVIKPGKTAIAAIPRISMSDGAALAGKSVAISPGHGLRWNGGSWAFERPIYCAPLSNEDLHNVELATYLNAYLLQDGAITKVYRCLDKNAGNYSPGRAWWEVSAGYWLEHLGYPYSVVASYTGEIPLGGGIDDSSDSLRSRPLASDYDNTDIYISIHTNGKSGDCTGSSCGNGTATYYDAGTEHAAWGAVSKTLAQSIQNAIIPVVRNDFGDSTWTDSGAINANGAYAETRIPQRAAILLELAFHDTCDRDALALRQEFFRSATMWAVYKGVCDYFGVTPTYALYASEYVSDTIPSQMLPGQSTDVTVTFRNRSVLWSNDWGFRLGGVDNSDPFAPTRVTLASDVGTGQTYTFQFTMTAPTTPGTYTTDWRMLREPLTWFGPTLTKQVEVARTYARGDFDQDHDVDVEDFGHLQVCYTNTGVPVTDANCLNASLDGDNDVDPVDIAIFLACFRGPGVQADPYCGG